MARLKRAHGTGQPAECLHVASSHVPSCVRPGTSIYSEVFDSMFARDRSNRGVTLLPAQAKRHKASMPSLLKDPDKPKRGRTAYFIFCDNQRGSMRQRAF